MPTTKTKTFSYDRSTKKVTMPAGTYVIGDPCYAVPDARWMEWLENAERNGRLYGINTDEIMVAGIYDYPVLGISTYGGDGRYESNKGHSFGVDSGMIGLVPSSVAPYDTTYPRVTFTDPVVCSYSEDQGTITIGDIVILTNADQTCEDCGVVVNDLDDRCVDCQFNFDQDRDAVDDPANDDDEDES